MAVELITATSQQSRFHSETFGSNSTEIDLRQVNLFVGDHQLLTDAHLRLMDGVHYGLIGRNGIGKSTLLKAIGWDLLVGLPKGLRALYVDQLEAVDREATVVQVVLNSDTRSVHLRHEATVLQAALESGSVEAVARAVKQLEYDRLKAEESEAVKVATKRSGARGFDARKVLVQLETKVAAAHEALTTPPTSEELASCMTKASGLLDDIYADMLGQLDVGEAEAKARRILLGLGFDETRQDAPIKTLSGGWRIRVALAQALFIEPDLLLLDEPTNHLDLPAILWLQDYINTLDGVTIVVVSHDRTFLNATVEEIILLRAGNLTYHAGNYDQYEADTKEKALHKERLKERVDKKRQHVERSIQEGLRAANQSGDSNKLGMVASRKKKLERLGMEKNKDGHRLRVNKDLAGYHLTAREEVEVDRADPPIQWKFVSPPPLRNAGPLLKLENVSFSYGATRATHSKAKQSSSHLVIQGITLNVSQGARVAIVGPNGQGKSTLLKLIMGELQPCSGVVERHTQAVLGYFKQDNVEELRVAGSTSLLEQMAKQYPGVKEQELRAHLGSFGVKGAIATQPLSELSGGQVVRVAIAQTAFKRPHLLILDEPSNHLDIQTTDALIESLRKFEGGVLLVSHDQYLVQSVGEEVYLMKGGKLRRLEKGLQEYVNTLLKQKKKKGRDTG